MNDNTPESTTFGDAIDTDKTDEAIDNPQHQQENILAANMQGNEDADKHRVVTDHSDKLRGIDRESKDTVNVREAKRKEADEANPYPHKLRD